MLCDPHDRTHGGHERWEYLYESGPHWYRSPETAKVWRWPDGSGDDAPFQVVAGTYRYGTRGAEEGSFTCPEGPEFIPQAPRVP